MGSSDARDMRPTDAAAGVFSRFKAHGSAQRPFTDLVVNEAIRDIHTDCNVVAISARSCDLQGYAAAGHATWSFITDGNNTFLEREYSAPASRMDQSLGTLNDRVKFACLEISWQQEQWIVYKVQWSVPFEGTAKMYYFLQPKQSSSTPDGLLLAASKWTSEVHDEIYVFDDGCWDKNRKLWAAVQSASWSDVILDPAMKDTLIADVQNFFDSRALYEEYAVPWKRGIIFHGTPGCGKTISIKALMNSLGKRTQPVASLYVKSLKSNCGTLQYSVREIFSKAREMAPCLLVFEDLDSLVVDEVRSYFLNEVDGLEDNDGILMIGSTNHLERLDAGISKRPSRFDRKYHYNLPGTRERVLYCEYWRGKLSKNSNVDFDPAICNVVAQLTEGFSFAYLKELFVQTLWTIACGLQSKVGEEEEDQEVAAATAKIVPGSAKLAKDGDKVTSNEGEEGTKTPEQWMPVVDIPAHLREKPLMRVIRKQVVALWKDMDNSKDEEAGVKPEAKGTTSEERPIRNMVARPVFADDE